MSVKTKRPLRSIPRNLDTGLQVMIQSLVDRIDQDVIDLEGLPETPLNPQPNHVLIYAQKITSSGKLRLNALFPTGAVQTIVTEP